MNDVTSTRRRRQRRRQEQLMKKGGKAGQELKEEQSIADCLFKSPK
jgi:hypothetical protein